MKARIKQTKEIVEVEAVGNVFRNKNNGYIHYEPEALEFLEEIDWEARRWELVCRLSNALLTKRYFSVDEYLNSSDEKRERYTGGIVEMVDEIIKQYKK